jgi:hypothetical protein
MIYPLDPNTYMADMTTTTARAAGSLYVFERNITHDDY